MAKILLVEDDNNLREIFELRLIAEGYQTVTAGNGEEALVVAMKEKPELIISDVMMPKLSGFEMLETLRAAPEMANTKCIMMTALGQAEDRARGESLGVIKYLVKSQVTLEDFVRVVREVVSPDGSPTQATAAPTPPVPANPQLQNNVESEQSMQNDQASPAPADGANPSANPINDAAAPGAAVTPDQQSSSQEQSAVQDQINSFVAGAPSDPTATPQSDAPAAQDASQDPASPAPAPEAGSDPTSAPAAGADAAAQPFPVSTPPAENATQPPADTGAPKDPASNTL